MSSERYQEYLRSPEWKAIARTVKERDFHRCQTCDGTNDLNVHHKHYENLYNEAEHPEDLITLCHRCHSGVHGILTAREQWRRRANDAVRKDPHHFKVRINKKNVARFRVNARSSEWLRSIGINPKGQWWRRSLIGVWVPSGFMPLEDYKAKWKPWAKRVKPHQIGPIGVSAARSHHTPTGITAH